MNDSSTILLAEDDENDVFLLRRAFKDADLQNPLQVVCDGQEAIDFLSRQTTSPEDRLPVLSIFDLKMPRCGGIEALKWMREQPVLCSLPVIMFSSSASRQDIEQAYALGANGFVVKPPSIAERADFARLIKQWLRFNQSPLACIEGFKSARALHVPRRGTCPPAP